MEVKAIFGERLRELRQKAGLQQSELGEKVGLSSNGVGMMERGHRGTSFEKLVQIARFFHVSTDYLLGVTDDPTWRGAPPEEES